MWQHIKARFIKGLYFRSLLEVLKSLIVHGPNSFDLMDKHILTTYFFGFRFSLNRLYYNLIKEYGEIGTFNFNGIIIPKIKSNSDRAAFSEQWLDIISPYLYKNKKSDVFIEGPYIYEEVCLMKGNIVIDVGANIGLFSALASNMGCLVYAFEPVKEIIESYLNITAKLNRNIKIVPFGLSDKKEFVNIKIERLGSSSIIPDKRKSIEKCTISEYIQTITLDDWVKENDIPRVDFIKADIEGAERLMIKGAKWALSTFAPNLAICTYHLPDDKKVLPHLILEANPSYNIIQKWKKLYAWVDKKKYN